MYIKKFYKNKKIRTELTFNLFDHGKGASVQCFGASSR